MHLKILQPSTIVLVTTFRCTAECENCCFGCRRDSGESMSLDNMKHYIDECMRYYGASIKGLVLTGGECMIFRENVLNIIKYASQLGLSTRIVTNAFWAKSYVEARSIVASLISCGLKEINFSTGDDHRKWIPWRNVRNTAVASARLGLTPFINIETHDNSNTSLIQWMKRDHVLFKLLEAGKIKIEKGIWVPFNYSRINKFEYKSLLLPQKHERCTSLFSTIPINPYGEVLACCGLCAENNPFLRIGNIKNKTIQTIYESSFKDLLKIWLFSDGPLKILETIYKDRDGCNYNSSGHICDLCRQLFKNHLNIEWLCNNRDKYLTSILLHYQLLTSKLK